MKKNKIEGVEESYQNCKIHNCQLKYICVDIECDSEQRDCCAECLVDGEHREHEYKSRREAVQSLQDGAIHALRYYEGCEKYLNIRPEVEQILENMKLGINKAIDEYKQKILYQVDTQKGSSDIDNTNQEQQEKLKTFLNSNDWPSEKINQELAFALLHLNSDKIMNEKVKQVIQHNQFIVKRVNKKMKEFLLQVKLFLDSNFKIFTQADFYHGKSKRGENFFETENNGEDSDDFYEGGSSRMEVDHPNYAEHQEKKKQQSKSPAKQSNSPKLNKKKEEQRQQGSSLSHSPKIAKNMFKEDAKDEGTIFQKQLTPNQGVRGSQEMPSNLKNNQMPSNLSHQPNFQLQEQEHQKNSQIKQQQPQANKKFQQYENPVSFFDTDHFEGKISFQYDGHTDFIRKLVKVDEETFLSISDDSTIKLWNFTYNQCIANFQGLHQRQILDIKMLRENTFISCGRDNKLVWLDVDRYQKDIRDVNKNILCLEILAERYILLGSIKHLYLVDDEKKETVSGNLLQLKQVKENAHEKEILQITCIQEQSVFATASYDKMIKIWLFQSEKQEVLHIKDLSGHKQAVRSLCVGIRTNLLFSGSDDSQVILWDWQIGQQIRSFQGHTAAIYAIDILSPNEIATGSYDKSIKIWNFNNGKCIGTVSGNQSGILCLIKYNQRAILTGCDDHTIKIWV
ncbi:hypothetical protein ABPG74_009103 [Tetrahymena malaccensis]